MAKISKKSHENPKIIHLSCVWGWWLWCTWSTGTGRSDGMTEITWRIRAQFGMKSWSMLCTSVVQLFHYLLLVTMQVRVYFNFNKLICKYFKLIHSILCMCGNCVSTYKHNQICTYYYIFINIKQPYSFSSPFLLLYNTVFNSNQLCPGEMEIARPSSPTSPEAWIGPATGRIMSSNKINAQSDWIIWNRFIDLKTCGTNSIHTA